MTLLAKFLGGGGLGDTVMDLGMIVTLKFVYKNTICL